MARGAKGLTPPAALDAGWLRQVLDALAGALVLLDPEGRITFANAAARRLAGPDAGPLEGRALRTLLPPASEVEYGPHLARALEGETQRFEIQHHFADGRRGWERVTYVPLRDAGGRVLQVMAKTEDITDAKRVEASLRGQLALESRLAGIAASVPGLIYTYRREPDGRTSMPFSTQRVEDLLGFPGQELTGSIDAVMARVDPADVAGLAASTVASARDLAPWHHTFRYLHPAKGPRVLEGWGVPRAEGGGAVLWHAFMMDVTEQRAAEEALRALDARGAERERHLQTVIRTALDGFVVIGAGGSFVDVNDAYCDMVGYSREELLAMSIPDVEAAETAEEHARHRARVLWQGSDRFETRHRRKDGRIIDVEVSAAGQADVMVAFIHEITQRKRAEDELRRSRAELRALTARLQAVREEEASRIARDLHDDLGQALTGLQLDLRWLEDRLEELPSDALHRHLLDRLVAASGLAAATASTVQRITRELRPAALDRLGLAAALRQELKQFEQRTGVRAEARLGADVALDGEVATALYRICQEALTNVARHSGASTVAVSLEVAGEVVTLRIEDDGRGPAEGGRVRSGALGIVGMRERALAIGGEVTVGTSPAGGTLVSARAPLSQGKEPG